MPPWLWHRSGVHQRWFAHRCGDAGPGAAEGASESGRFPPFTTVGADSTDYRRRQQAPSKPGNFCRVRRPHKLSGRPVARCKRILNSLHMRHENIFKGSAGPTRKLRRRRADAAAQRNPQSHSPITSYFRSAPLWCPSSLSKLFKRCLSLTRILAPW